MNDNCFGRPIVSSSDIEACVDIVPVADAKSSVDVSSSEPGDFGVFGDNNCSQSLNIFIDTSAKGVNSQ